MHDYCKNDKITCSICESSSICYCSDEQPISGFCKNDKATEQATRLGQTIRWRLRSISEGIAGDYAVHEKVFVQMVENGLFSEPSSPLKIEKLTPEEKWKLIDKARRQEK
jgi:hypothetical protein